MKSLSKKIDVYGLTADEIQQLRKIAKERYGKASVSLLARKLLQEQLPQHKEPADKLLKAKYDTKQRITLRIPSQQFDYLQTMAQQRHSSLNDVIRDVIQEFITGNPVLNNDEVQALYQSNYQLLRLGRNINQIARQLNSIMPDSFTTHQLNELLSFLQKHTDQVGQVLRKQGKSFKYQKIRELSYESTESEH